MRRMSEYGQLQTLSLVGQVAQKRPFLSNNLAELTYSV